MISGTPRISGLNGGGGSPSAPDQSIQYNNAGSFYGDALATRDPITNITNFGRSVSADVMTSFGLTSSLLGGLSASVMSVTDSSLSTGTYVFSGDISPFGGSTTASGLLGVDSAGNFQTLLMQPDGLRGSITDGTQETVFELESSEASIKYNNGSSINSEVNTNVNRAELVYQNLPAVNNKWRVDTNGASYWKGSTKLYNMPTTAVSPGQVLVGGAAPGSVIWSGAPQPPLTTNYIGFGDANLLSGNASFQYVGSDYNFAQLIPSNTGDGGLLTSPLSFGSLTWNTVGLNDLTLTWSESIYKSKKYGGNLTIEINSTGTPDTFLWIYTGPYSEPIGSGYSPITAGFPHVLNDINGNKIGEITFGNDSGHSGGESWTASSSLGTFPWGQILSDSNGDEFVIARPVFGSYSFGAGNDLTGNLHGNGTRLQINDELAELGLFVKHYFRIEAPGIGTPIVLADMETGIWSQYGNSFRVLDYYGNNWGNVNPQGSVVAWGDLSNSGNGTTLTIDDVNQLVTITNVPTYADDAAAITGGLTTGQLYKTTTGGITSLNIVP